MQRGKIGIGSVDELWRDKSSPDMEWMFLLGEGKGNERENNAPGSPGGCRHAE